MEKHSLAYKMSGILSGDKPSEHMLLLEKYPQKIILLAKYLPPPKKKKSFKFDKMTY